MEQKEAIREALDLINRSQIVMLATNGDEGYPIIKAMIKVENEGLKRIWFGTNTSSRKVRALTRNPKACVYFIDMDQWKGLSLIGEMEILTDLESRQRVWRPGNEKYYPLGINDPDNTVLRFTARQGNYYHALDNVSFEL